MVNPADRMSSIKGHFFAAHGRRVNELKSAGKDIIRMDVGSPDMPPASFIIDSLVEASKLEENHGYQPHKGTPELRQAWGELYRRDYGVELDPETDVLPLIGSKEGIFNLTQAYVQPGDVVLVPDPAYLSYEQAAIFAGGTVIRLPIDRDNHFLPDLSKIDGKLLERAKLLWLNYPNNPTTALVNLDYFQKVIEFGLENKIIVCNDAAYTQVTFSGEMAPSILEVNGAIETAVEFNSLSKSHNMAGWRTGALVGNPEVIRNTFRLKSNIDSGHFSPIIKASITAMIGDQKWKLIRNDEYRKRRDIVLNSLNEIGLEAEVPQATIYVWSAVPPGWTSFDFVNSALENTGVSFAPGTIFGVCGEGYIRIALVQPQERIQTAMERMNDWIT